MQKAKTTLEAIPGSYALVLKSLTNTTIEIGRWGSLDIKPGYFIYVGSAFGPGGVAARVSRHCRQVKSRHWHIDYLREFTDPIIVLYSYDPVRYEHTWAMAMSQLIGNTSIKGFGCSDCNCESHLFYSPTKPEISQLTKAMDGATYTWVPEEKK